MTTFGDQLFQYGGQPVCSGSNYPGDYGYTQGHQTEGNRVYYVNNITGNSEYDGFSWETPFAQVSEAITASEAHRATLTTNNQCVRNRIYVQGTSTAYTLLTALPLHCDIIGIGADVRGTGSGIPRIGSDTVAESGCVASATVRGLYVSGIQFQAGINCYPFQCANMFRSTFDNCSFMTNGVATGNPAAAFYAAGAVGGCTIKRCFFGSSASLDTEPDIGFKIAGTHWHNNLVEDCFITGITGISVASTVTYAWGSIFKNNYIGDGSQIMTIGVNDDCVGGASRGYIVYAGNYMKATAAFDIESDTAARAIGNYAANAFVASA